MRLLKIILVLFLIYFIRRFLQMYKVMKAIQQEQKKQNHAKAESDIKFHNKGDTIVDADYKVMD